MPQALKKTESPTTAERLMAGKLLLRVDEVALILRVGKSLVYDMVACEELAHKRVRGAIRVPTASVRELLAGDKK